MNKSLAALIAQRTEKTAAAGVLINAGEAENRDLNETEQVSLAAIKADLKGLDARIERMHEQEKAELRAGSIIIANPDSPGSLQGGAPEKHKDPKGLFQSFGEFAHSVVLATVSKNRNVDERLIFQAAAPSTGMREAVGADGGFLVPPEFSSEVWRLTITPNSILPLTSNVEIQGNTMSFPKDISVPWGTDGIQAYWQAELTAGTPTKPALQLDQLYLEKLMALVPVSEEMVDDAPALNSYLQPLIAERMQWKYEDAFFHALGVGMPKGFMTSSGLITVTKTAGFTYTAGAAVSVQDVGNMMCRMTAAGYSRAVWMIHPSLIGSLIALQIGTHPMWMPPGGLVSAPAGTLLGRPIIVSEHCRAPLVAGDIVLADWKGYRTITKAGGMKTATSMHLYFDADAIAFRTTFRINGQPILNAAINPANGSETLGHFIVLDDTR